ncbi:hypothetical protein ACFQ67_05445 [Streptomyces sp. NPDC056488]|uniref:hypothetical protein n=1 Tax=Streptomyces sp. NPDC056488 TaxID=3345836 RepID=UPI003690649B
MKPREKYISELFARHNEWCARQEAQLAKCRSVFMAQADRQVAQGDAVKAAKSRALALSPRILRRMAEREEQLIEWLNDPLVWVRPTNTSYAEIYHYTKKCPHVQRGYVDDFLPRLEGEAKTTGKAGCTSNFCTSALWAWQNVLQKEVVAA